jgi:cyclase
MVRFEELAANVLMFVGEDHESVATAFIDGDDALLVDSLGCIEDAQWLHRVLCEEMGKTVRVLAATHFMSDHMAGLSLFPNALTIAHRHYRHTFLSQNRPVDELYREPQLTFDGTMTRLAPAIEPTAFEREWPQNNLNVIVAQSVFALDTTIASRTARA